MTEIDISPMRQVSEKDEKMAVPIADILARFPDLLKFERGNRETAVRCIQASRIATPQDLIFVSEAKHLEEARQSHCRNWVLKSNLAKEIDAQSIETLILSPNPYLAMALVAKAFFPLDPGLVPVDGAAVHPSAVIATSARLGRHIKIGPGAVISDHVELSDDVVIGANCVIEPSVKIGARTRIHPLVFIGHSCVIGQDCEIKPHTTIGGAGFGFAHDEKGGHHSLTHYGRVIVADRVSIGSNVQIDRGTFEDSFIGENVKIDNHSHFGHNIVIGKNTIVVAGALVAGSVKIGSNCLFAGRTSISGHLEITDNVQLMALTAVGKPITAPGQYGGLPIQDYKDVLKSRAVIPLLPKLKKQVSRILKKLEMEDDL